MGHVIAVNLMLRSGRRADYGRHLHQLSKGDSGVPAGRLRNALSNHFGARQVFRDTDTINPGERFPRIVEKESSLGIAEAACAPVTDQLEQAHDGSLAPEFTILAVAWMLWRNKSSGASDARILNTQAATGGDDAEDFHLSHSDE